MKLIQRILGSVAIIAIFILLSALFIHYTKPAPLKNLSSVTASSPEVVFDIAGENLPPTITPEEKETAITDNEVMPAASVSEKVKNDILQNSSINTTSQKSWVVQLGTFAHLENAIKLIQTLNDKGFHAFSRQVFIRDQIMTQVLVGPEPDYHRIESLKGELIKAVQLEGRILAFDSE